MGSRTSWRLVRQGEHPPFEVSSDAIVGRSKQSDLCLNEGFVSRRHARLWLESGRLMVEDLGSANGTFVNGRRLTGPASLAPGDCVTFDVFDYFVEGTAPRPETAPSASGLTSADREPETGIEDLSDDLNDGVSDEDVTGPALFEQQPPDPHPLEPGATQPMAAVATERSLPPLDDSAFDLDVDELGDPDSARTDESARNPPSALSATVAMGPGEWQDAPPPPDDTPVPDAAGDASSEPVASERGKDPLDPSAPALLATSGPLEGSLIHLESGRILLGRGVECDIWIDHPAVSRQHLEIFLSGGRSRVRQMEGADGALLNGAPLGDTELIPGDVLRIGSVEFIYDSFERLTEDRGGFPPWLWMLVGFLGAGAVLTGLFMFVL